MSIIRVGLFKENIAYDEMQKYFMDNLKNETAFFNEYHAHIDGIGSNFCFGKNPKCGGCPLNMVCEKKMEVNENG